LSASFYFIFEDGRRNEEQRDQQKKMKRDKKKKPKRTRERVFVVCEWREREGKKEKSSSLFVVRKQQ